MYKLYTGRNWARIVFIAMIVIAVARNLLLLLSGLYSAVLAIMVLITVVVQCVMGIVLAINDNVKEFLDDQYYIH